MADGPVAPRRPRATLRNIWPGGYYRSTKNFALLGFRRAAEREAAAASDEPRRIVEAYARGVNRFIEQHQNQLPLEFSLLRYKPQPWTPADTFAIGGYMYRPLRIHGKTN